jgi:hypothetical protein
MEDTPPAAVLADEASMLVRAVMTAALAAALAGVEDTPVVGSCAAVP